MENQRVELIGASIPRSGHHFLVKLLELSLGDEFSYCACNSKLVSCNQEGCTRDNSKNIFYRKSHDYDFSLDSNDTRDNVVYIVQHREPRGQILSAADLIREKSERKGEGWPESREQLLRFLAKTAFYVTRFYSKWLVKPQKNFALIDYDKLVASPTTAVASIFEKMGIEFTQQKSNIVEAASKKKAVAVGQVLSKPFVVRDRDNSPVIPSSLLASYENLVLQQCPAAGWKTSSKEDEISEELQRAYAKFYPAATSRGWA